MFGVLIYSGEVDQYFNAGATYYPAGNYSSLSYESGSVVDLYDNVITFYYDSSTKHLTLTKMNEQGILDTSFGTAGVKTINYSSLVGTLSNFRIVTDPTTGNIIVAFVNSNGGVSAMLVQRYLNSSGSLDISFGTAGSVAISLDATLAGIGASTHHNFSGLFFDSMGRLIITTVSKKASGGSYNYYVIVWRYTSDGVRDFNNFLTIDSSNIITSEFGYTSPIVLQAAIDQYDNMFIVFLNYSNIRVYVRKYYISSNLLVTDNNFGTLGRYEISLDALSVFTLSNHFKIKVFPPSKKDGTIYFTTYADSRFTNIYGNTFSLSVRIFRIPDGANQVYENWQHDYTDSETTYDVSKNSNDDFLFVSRSVTDNNVLFMYRYTNEALLASSGNINRDTHFGTDTENHRSSFSAVSGRTIASVSATVDSGDAMIVSAVELNSNHYLSLHKYLVADHVNQLLNSSKLPSQDAYQLINYFNDLDRLRAYLNIDYLVVNLKGWSRASGLISAEIDFYTAFNIAFNEAIVRSIANGFASCAHTKYKPGVFLREINSRINSTNYTTDYTNLRSKVDDILRVIGSKLDAARSELISE